MPPKYPVKLFLRRSAFVGSIRIVGLLCVFALQVLLARLIGDSEEYGEYAWGQSLLFLAGTFACMGLPAVTNRFVASLNAQGNETAIANVIHKARSLLFTSTGLLVVTAVLLAIFWPESTQDQFYRNTAILALLLAPALSFTNLYIAIFKARQWLGFAFIPFYVLRPIVTGIIAFVCWYLYNKNLSGLQTLALAGGSILLLLLPQIFVYRRRMVHIKILTDLPQPSTDYHPSRLFRTALPVFASLCANLTIKYSNVILVGFLGGPAAAGVYFAAERLAQLATIPQAVVSSVNQQAMATAHAQNNHSDLQKVTSQTAHGSLWPTLIIGVGLTIMGEPLLHLFGKDFASAHLVLIILAASTVFSVLMGPAQDVLLMTGRQRKVPRITIIAAIIHIAALSVLVPALGALGAAISTVASTIVANIWLMLLAKKEMGIGTTILGNRAS